jgi:hypothetical protein
LENEKKHNQTKKESENFGLPDGYFQKSANSINNKIEWQEEHVEFKKLVSLKNSPCFEVPQHYFSKNEQQLELSDYPVLKSLGNKSGFDVPNNYFENSDSDSRILLLQNAPSFEKLEALKKQTHFSVPQNYFNYKEKNLNQLLEPKKAKVISLFTKRIRFAAAALLLVVLSVWFYAFYFTTAEVEDCGTIACLDRQDLVKTKNLERLNDDELYDLVDPAALEQKLENTKTKQTKENFTDSSLNDISVEDLLDNI